MIARLLLWIAQRILNTAYALELWADGKPNGGTR